MHRKEPVILMRGTFPCWPWMWLSMIRHDGSNTWKMKQASWSWLCYTCCSRAWEFASASLVAHPSLAYPTLHPHQTFVSHQKIPTYVLLSASFHCDWWFWFRWLRGDFSWLRSWSCFGNLWLWWSSSYLALAIPEMFDVAKSWSELQ